MKLLACTLSVLQLSALSTATPFITQDDPSSELISEDLFQILSLYEQYSAAAYCAQNYDSKFRYNTLTCLSGNCPQVQGANITLQLTA